MKKTYITLLMLFNTGAVFALPDCPDSPNCVSSQSAKTHDSYIDPLEFNVTKNTAHAAVVKHLSNTPRVVITENTPNEIKAEFTSRLFGWVDDVVIEISNDKIHWYSASRDGYWDFGANRRRIDRFRDWLIDELSLKE